MCNEIKSFLDTLFMRMQHSLLRIKNCDKKMVTSHVIVCIQPFFYLVYWKQQNNEIHRNFGLISEKKRYICWFLTGYIIMQIRFYINWQGFNSSSFDYLKNDLYIAVSQQFLSIDYQMLNFFLLFNCLIVETIFH